MSGRGLWGEVPEGLEEVPEAVEEVLEEFGEGVEAGFFADAVFDGLAEVGEGAVVEVADEAFEFVDVDADVGPVACGDVGGDAVEHGRDVLEDLVDEDGEDLVVHAEAGLGAFEVEGWGWVLGLFGEGALDDAAEGLA